MRSRDRLAELRHAAAGAGTGVGAGACEAPGPRAAPDPDIDRMFQEVERMRGWIHDINGNTQLVRRLHSDPTYHTNKQLQEQLESVIQSSSAAAVKVSGALRDFEGRVRGGAGGATGRMARLQYAATRALYGDALAAHHAALAAVRDHQRGLLHEQIKLTNLMISDEECEALLESKNLSLFVDNVKAETAEARRMLREVEARHEELTRIETSLRDVRDLFTQLAVLVAAQQEQVDSVEYYALQATEHVESGGNELLKGTITRTKTRKKKLSLIICVVTGAFVVLLVLVFT